MRFYQEHTADLNSKDLRYIKETIINAKEAKPKLFQGLIFSLITPILVFVLYQSGSFSNEGFTFTLITILLVVALFFGYSFAESVNRIRFYQTLKSEGQKPAVTGLITDKKLMSGWNSADESKAHQHIIELGEERLIHVTPTQFDTLVRGDKITATFDVKKEFNLFNQNGNSQVDKIVKHKQRI